MSPGLWNRVRSLFKRVGNEDELLEALILADVGPELSQNLIKKSKGKGELILNLKQELIDILSLDSQPFTGKKPIMIMVIGSNGTGKTTTLAKLANYYRKKNNKIMIASADTYRDAANEQLSHWANKVGVDIISSQKGQDAGAVVFDAFNSAQVRKIDFLLIDTAGRLHSRKDLMAELKKIVRVTEKLKPNGVDKTYLILDATTGQNGLIQAERFKSEIGIDGIIIAKMDGSAKGGIAIAISNRLKIPIEFIGVGEEIEDLLPFDAEKFVEAIF